MADVLSDLRHMHDVRCAMNNASEASIYSRAADEIERLRELFGEQSRVNRDTGLEVLRLRAAVERAYSLLWSVMTDNQRVHEARRLLLSVLTKEQQRAALAGDKGDGNG